MKQKAFCSWSGGKDSCLALQRALRSGYDVEVLLTMFDETADLGQVLIRIARFFRHESCGQCVPCRVGTMRQEEIVRRIVGGNVLESRDREVALLNDVARAMRDASICGLGQTAANAIESALGMLSR